MTRTPRLKLMLRALSRRNYRLFFCGHGISMIGTWMQSVAMSWLVYRLTDSELLLGIVAFSNHGPALFVAPVAGVLADRWDRRKVVMVTQALAMLQALVLAVLTLTGLVQIWHILVLGLFLGAVGAVDMTARQSFVVDMVERKEDLPNAIALNSFLVNMGKLLGPALAGWAIHYIGEGNCFLINGVSYLALLTALTLMRFEPRERPVVSGRVIDQITDGFRYCFGFPPIRSLLLLVSLASLLAMPYVVLMPVFAKQILGGGPRELGLLMSAAGVGALLGAVFLASRSTVVGLGRVIGVAAFALGVLLVLFSQSRVFAMSWIFVAGMGFAQMLQYASTNSVLQTICDDDKRGRMMSFYTTAIRGMLPFGGLFMGWLAHQVGAPTALTIGGACCIAGSLVFASRLSALGRLVQPIYQRLGLLPESVEGINPPTAIL